MFGFFFSVALLVGFLLLVGFVSSCWNASRRSRRQGQRVVDEALIEALRSAGKLSQTDAVALRWGKPASVAGQRIYDVAYGRAYRWQGAGLVAPAALALAAQVSHQRAVGRADWSHFSKQHPQFASALGDEQAASLFAPTPASRSSASLFDDGDLGGIGGESASAFAFDEINPATGLPMIGGMGGIDVAGNPYGVSDDDPFCSSGFDHSSCGMDDSWSSGGFND